MPIYVLRCVVCNRVEEVLVDTFKECPTRCCRCNGVLKYIWDGPPAFRFKGAGFYVNDSKKKEQSNNGK
jgi:predicted nucleic acid-binding Zn ribbon protein